MRYRMYASQQAEQQTFDTEEELIDALSSRGWDLLERATREAKESRERRFRLARQSRFSNRPRAM
ncbi:MAG TPA: hypothetical protein VHC69_19950 [Polyangiaceae bacterium]|nr:hypothetical protein [Polyangiaceae bacterium]